MCRGAEASRSVRLSPSNSFSTTSSVMCSQQCSCGAAGGRPALLLGAVFIVSAMRVASLMTSQLGQAHLIKQKTKMPTST